MLDISLQNMELILRIVFLIGAITDFFAIFPLISIKIGNKIFQADLDEKNESNVYTMRIAASLMAGWTILLIWGFISPIQRRDVLLITILPVVIGIIVSTFLAMKNRKVSKNRLIPLIIHLFFVSILMIGSYIISLKF